MYSKVFSSVLEGVEVLHVRSVSKDVRNARVVPAALAAVPVDVIGIF